MDFSEQLEKHRQEEDKKFDALNELIVNLRDNHLSHLKEAIASINTDIKWIKWIVMGSCGTLGAGIAYKIITKFIL